MKLIVLALPAFLSTLSASASPMHDHKRALATVYSECIKPKTVALTFDDGPYNYETDIVNTLDAAGVKGTFFLNGDNYRCIFDAPAVTALQKAYASGHQIASHTWAHLDLTELSASQITSEMQRTNTALQKVVGVTPAFVRPPFGSTNNNVRTVAASLNQTVALWNLDTEDWDGRSAKQIIAAYDSFSRGNPNSSIVSLGHSPLDVTAHQVLPSVISSLKQKGYTFVTFAECVGSNTPYLTIAKPGTRDNTWRC